MNQNICQLDGHETFDSSSSSFLSEPFCPCCVSLSGCESLDYSYDQDSDYDIGLPIPALESWMPPDGLSINPPAWYEEYSYRAPDPSHSKVNRITIKRDNRLVIGESLPIIAVSNLRSLTPKLNNFKDDLIEREISVALLSEVWEKTSCKKQQYEVEKMFQLDGLKYISTPRITKRGGGLQ